MITQAQNDSHKPVMTAKEYAAFRKLFYATYPLTKPERRRFRELLKKDLPPEQSPDNQNGDV